MRFIRPSRMATVLVGMICAAPTAQVLAQALLEEVVVTARRYEESITDAPVAVAVMSDEFLRENRVDTIQDILELTPGANWGQFAKAQPALALRGLNGSAFGNASLEHSVSVVMDGVPVTKAFMITVPVYDMQRVEVLRGPQGTAFGRNATLGLMNFITARPSQEFSSNIDITAGSLDLGGVSGHVNGSLGENISGRLAFHRQYTGGSVEDENTGELIEYFDNTSLRGSLLIEPSDNLTAFIKAEIITDEEYPTTRTGKVEGAPWLNATHGNYSVPEDTWQGSLAPPLGDPWVVERDMQFLTAELVWDLDNDRAVTWISGYQTGDHYSNSAAFGTPYNLREQAVWNDGNVFSQEVRFDNQASADRLRWVAGAFFQTDEEHRIERNETHPVHGPCTAADPLDCWRNSTLYTDAVNESTATGLFGEINYDLNESLILAVGARYSTDARDLDFATYGYGAAGGLGGIGLGNSDPSRDCSQPESQYSRDWGGMTVAQCGTEANPVGFDGLKSESWSQFSPRVSLTWAVNDNNNLYALYSEGFKAGGFQHDARTASNLDVVLNAETAPNFELGWKGQYDNLIFAFTAFNQKQQDLHTGNLVLVGTSQANLLVNSEGVENTGLEIEWTWAVTDGFTFGGAIASYDPKFLPGSQIAATFNANTGEFANDGEDVSGRRPTNAIDSAANLWATYDWQMANGGSWRIRADLRHRGDVWGQTSARDRAARSNFTGEIYNLRPVLNKTSLRLAYTSPNENWGLSLWGRNLDDEPDYLNFGPGFGWVFLQLDNGARARPVGKTGRRQIGATVSFNF